MGFSIGFQHLSNQNVHNWWFIQNGNPAVNLKIASCSFGLQLTGYTHDYLFKFSIFLCVHPVRHGDALQCRVHHPGDNLPKERGGRDSWEVSHHGVRVCCESWQIVPVSVSLTQRDHSNSLGWFFMLKEMHFSPELAHQSNFAFQACHKSQALFAAYSHRMLNNLRILKFQSIGDTVAMGVTTAVSLVLCFFIALDLRSTMASVKDPSSTVRLVRPISVLNVRSMSQR